MKIIKRIIPFCVFFMSTFYLYAQQSNNTTLVILLCDASGNQLTNTDITTSQLNNYTATLTWKGKTISLPGIAGAFFIKNNFCYLRITLQGFGGNIVPLGDEMELTVVNENGDSFKTSIIRTAASAVQQEMIYVTPSANSLFFVINTQPTNIYTSPAQR